MIAYAYRRIRSTNFIQMLVVQNDSIHEWLNGSLSYRDELRGSGDFLIRVFITHTTAYQTHR